ncbi:RND family transporter [Bacteriovorax sp. Seq25_V]|uniref:efflux RND transporter permease subunit n=1 Tax=Bacteriovorax sp. Seq25_V TaxID=1201288 RepID=UPI000389EE08|nr:MMPL family transporter [Bacteriovorax sp. Seq25_V]EQC46532.1 sterol-sensing domain of SREBP cleavage-activation [Bacteriovorax sp. Seq25_V]
MEKIENVAQKLSSNIVRKSKLYISLSLIAFILLTSGIFLIKSNFSVKVWLNKNDHRINDLNLHEKTFGSSDTMDVIIYNDRGIFNPHTISTIQEISEEMWKVKDIVRVESLTNYNWIESIDDDISITPFIAEDDILTEEFLNKKKNQALGDKHLVNNLISPSGKLAYIRSFLQVTNGTPPYEEIVTQVESLIKKYNHDEIHIQLSGITFINESLKRASDRDMVVVFPLVFIALVIILFAFFRNLFGVISPFVIILLTIASTFGVEGFLGIEFNNILAAVPAVLIAIGLADSVHILISYRHGTTYEGLTNEDAATRALSKNFIPTILTTITTSIGFLSLLTADIRPIHDLGMLSGIGCIFAWFFTYFLLGAFLKYINFPQRKAKEDLHFIEHIGNFSHKYRLLIVITFPLLALFMAYLGSKNIINADPVEYFSESTPIKKTFNLVEREFGASRAIELVFDSGIPEGIKDVEFLKKSELMINWIEQLPEVKRVTSIETILKKMNQTLHGDDPNFYKIPETRREVADQLFLYTLGLPSGMDLKNQISIDNRKFRVLVLWHVNDTMTAIEKSEIILAKAKEIGLNVYEGGQSPIYNRVNDLVVNTFFYSMGLTLPLIFLIMFLTFKDLKLAILSLIPNVFPLMVASGIMYLNGDEINIGNVIVFAVCLGIAVDDTIHFIANYKIKILKGHSTDQALKETLIQTGKALILTTVLLFFGFGLFAFGDFVPNQKFGIYCAMILILALISDVILLPAILYYIYRTKK